MDLDKKFLYLALLLNFFKSFSVIQTFPRHNFSLLTSILLNLIFIPLGKINLPLGPALPGSPFLPLELKPPSFLYRLYDL